jgi:NAD(P)H-dependent FMN reductase
VHIVSISASNIQHARPYSTSTRACHLVEEIARECVDGSAPLTFDLISLADDDLQPCVGCGACFSARTCPRDPVFNTLYQRITAADALFIVAAHYAPIPAKLCMLLEKIEQLAFLPRFHDEKVHSPLYQKPVGIIGHCGGTADLLPHGYQGQILDTIANALGWPVQMKVIPGPEYPTGVLFPVHRVRRDPASPFPLQEYDWAEIKQRITPLVLAVMTINGPVKGAVLE